jgi:hypothetical protein
MQAEASFDHCFAFAERIIGKTDARLGEKLCAVVGKSGVADDRRGVDDSVGEGVVGGAALNFILAI